jgi:uncharacterized protein YyaL (SSP411 family)
MREEYLGLAHKLADEAIGRFGAGGHWLESDGDFAAPASIEGNAYRSPLAVMAENLLRLEILTDTPRYGAAAQAILKQGSATIAGYPTAAPYGVLAALEDRYGYIVIKARTEQLRELKRQTAAATPYPFIVYREHDDAMILACRKDRCFAYDKDPKKLVEKVVESLKQDGVKVRSGM